MDVETTGTFEMECQEDMIEQTTGEGSGEHFTMGLPPVAEQFQAEQGQDVANLSDLDGEEDGQTSHAPTIPDKSEVTREWALEARSMSLNFK